LETLQKVILYARVSTKEQDTAMQLESLRAYAKAQGWRVVEEYVDHGWSGAKSSRPALDRLMRDACKGLRDFDAVLVWKLDRFGRSLQHLLDKVAALQEAGIGFISQKDGFDLSTPMGKMMFQMLGVFAEFERNIIAERIRAGFKKSTAKRPGPKIGPEGPSRTTLWRRSKQ
jgi:DNA invertase Pin-like site-specific DNA recombinase